MKSTGPRIIFFNFSYKEKNQVLLYSNRPENFILLSLHKSTGLEEIK